jgi:hypothetical protein
MNKNLKAGLITVGVVAGLIPLILAMYTYPKQVAFCGVAALAISFIFHYVKDTLK